uniref:Exocyst complex component Sec6 n=1 Tax=Tetraodon nigroviridis TaxID=99883 RepID=H3C172_TETNG
PEELRVEALMSAVKAINLEAEQDRRWKQRADVPPAWRLHEWRSLHDETLRRLVERRMDNPTVPAISPVKQSSFQQDITSMARQLKEDLLLVVSALKDCYPPEMDICNVYARLFHQTFSSRITKISDFGLDNKDCTVVLQWVNVYYPGILQIPELAPHISIGEMGKLLSEEALGPLEKQYLSKQQEVLASFIHRILEEAKEKWSKGEEPTSEDGCFISPVAYDIIQVKTVLRGTAVGVVFGRVALRLRRFMMGEGSSLPRSFKNFQNEIIKQNKLNSRSFVKAKLSCLEQFSEVLQNQSELFMEDVLDECSHILADMRRSAHEYLLKPVHEALKPQYRKIGTTEWLNNQVFEKLLMSLQQEIPVLQGSTPTSHQNLIGQMHLEVTVEYVKRLLKGELKLKDKSLQLKACETLMEDAKNLHAFFITLGSKEDWLQEVLPGIAEVLKLQDLPAIQMQVAALGTTFPDLSVRHVSALLKLKTNLSRADRRKVKDLMETLNESSSDHTLPFFSLVLVK